MIQIVGGLSNASGGRQRLKTSYESGRCPFDGA